MSSDERCSEFSSVTADTPDQRLIHLTRLLARQAAREAFAEIAAGQSTNRLPKFRSDSCDD